MTRNVLQKLFEPGTLGIVSLAAFVLGATVCSKAGDEIPRPHVLFRWGGEPLDWDADGSLALVATNDDSQSESENRVLVVPDPALVEQTLAINYPSLSDEEIAFLADVFLEAFESRGGEALRANFAAAPLIHVTTEGTEFLNADTGQVFGNRSLPVAGSTAEAGPRGHVLVLGEFYVVPDESAAHSSPAHAYVLASEGPSATPIQVAVCLFSH